jgi:hypothetical protein
VLTRQIGPTDNTFARPQKLAAPHVGSIETVNGGSVVDNLKEYREISERIGKLYSDLEMLEARRAEIERGLSFDRARPIEKPVDTYTREESAPANGGRKPQQSPVEPRQFSANSPPSLTHTKVLSLKLNGKLLRETTWNGLLLEAIRLAKAKARTDNDLRRLVTVNFVVGKKEDEGYQFFPEIGLSVQGQDADAAWRAAYHIARQLGIPIEAEFAWRMKDGAAHPGVTGRLSA